MKDALYLSSFEILSLILVSVNGDGSLVHVQQGWLQGEVTETVTGDEYYQSFKGIPYARPPLGTLRFKAPLPALPWMGVRNATEHGSICPQVDNSTHTVRGSEDCLFLNVYSPNLDPVNKLTVMVFIHGGSYIKGSGNVNDYGPDFLVTKKVVVVTMNYRLGALGFLCIDTEDAPGNAGLKDQHAALEWVQANIATFGGDPEKVTIIGHSAGSASVAFHILSPKSKGLFKRAISMSGVPYCDFSIPFQPRRRAFTLGKVLGFETGDEKELISFLQSVEADRLVDVFPSELAFEDITNNIIKRYPFVPVVEKIFDDNNFLIEDPSVILSSKDNINEVDIMFGYTNEESLIVIRLFENYLIEQYNEKPEMFVPTKVLYHNTPSKILGIHDKIRRYYFGDKTISTENMREFVSYMSNATFIYDINRFYSKFPKLDNNNMYFYKFSSVSDRNVHGNEGIAYGIKGAAHSDDLMYLFDAKALNMRINKNSKEYALIQQTTTLFTNFVKFGNPTPDYSLGIIWPEYDNVSVSYVDIGHKLTVSRAPDDADVSFWKTILEEAGISW